VPGVRKGSEGLRGVVGKTKRGPLDG
jgi:hypothetical protein